MKHVVCRGPHLSICPKFYNDCSRVVLDNKFHMNDIHSLHEIASKGMSVRNKVGGPTILDINTVRMIVIVLYTLYIWYLIVIVIKNFVVFFDN